MLVSLLRTLALLLLCLEVNAQDVLDGRVYELGTTMPLTDVRVSNVNSGKSTITNSEGRFKLPAKKGDVIALYLYSYQPDTVFLIELKARDFFLQPISHELNAVTVEGVKTQLGSLVDKTPQNVTYQRNPDGSPKGGLVFRLSYWNKDSKKERRALRKLKDFELQEEIDRVFSLAFISQYTPLRGVELNDFRSLYRPSVQLYKSPGFDLLLYLNDVYKEFKTLPPEKRKLPLLVPFDPAKPGK